MSLHALFKRIPQQPSKIKICKFDIYKTRYLGSVPDSGSNNNNSTGVSLSEILFSFTLELDSTRRKASEICLRPPLDIYSHTFSR